MDKLSKKPRAFLSSHRRGTERITSRPRKTRRKFHELSIDEQYRSQMERLRRFEDHAREQMRPIIKEIRAMQRLERERAEAKMQAILEEKLKPGPEAKTKLQQQIARNKKMIDLVVKYNRWNPPNERESD